MMIGILLATLLLSLLHSSGAAENPAQPTFDPAKCEVASNVVCLLADPLKTLYTYELPNPLNPSDAQLVIRIFTKKKFLIEAWSSGTSISLNDQKDQVIFQCSTEADGHVVSGPDSVKLLGGSVTNDILYCLLIVEHPSDILPDAVTHKERTQQKLNLVAGTSSTNYSISRGTITNVINGAIGGCSPNLIGSEKLTVKEGYRLTDIPHLNLFNTTITCPQLSTLVYKNKNQVVEAYSITCEEDENTGKNAYKITKDDQKSQKIKEGQRLEAGCKYRECDLCGAPSFACQEPDCKPPTKAEDDGCTFYQCPHSIMRINGAGDYVRGQINCTKLNDDYVWAFGTQKVEKANCPAELPCDIISPLNCDRNCSMLTDQSSSSVVCADKAMTMRAGETLARTLVCKRQTGRFQIVPLEGGDETVLPLDATIRCEGEAPSAGPADAEASTGNAPLYAGIGLGVAAVLIGVGVGVFCLCRRRKRRQSGPVPTDKTQPTTAQTTTTKTTTTGKSTETTKQQQQPQQPQPQPAVSVPVAAPTPLVKQPGSAPATPWDGTERTPNLPTPIRPSISEAPTQDAKITKTRSSRSGPQLPPPPIPLEDNNDRRKSQRDDGDSRKSRGGRRDEDSDVMCKKSGTSQPPKQKKRRSRQSRKSSHHNSSLKPTQVTEFSTKPTQDTRRTKRTQHTQATVSAHDVDEGADADQSSPVKPKPTKAPPKKPIYTPLADAQKDEKDDDSDEVKPHKLIKDGPIVAPAKSPVGGSREPAYLQFAQFASQKDLANIEKEKASASSDLKLVTQNSEEDKSKK